MFKRYPLLIWAGTWLIVMVMGWTAIAILLNPTFGQRPHSNKRHHTNSTSSVEQRLQRQATPRSQDDPALALWTLGVVAISCGYGSAILSQRIRPTNRR